MDKMLTAEEVIKIADRPVNIVLYPDLHKYKNIDELFTGKDNVLLMYQNDHGDKYRSGHWSCLKRLDNNNIVFFDSYGRFPDQSLLHIPPEYRMHTQQLYNYLSDLMYRSPYKLHYNDHKYQQSKMGVNTCGRHCGIYMRLDYDPEKYYKFMKNFNYKNFDKLAVDLTNTIL